MLLADDHPVVRAGLAGMLGTEPDLDVVGEAGDGEEAVVLARALRPDLVLMDLRMPRLDGATGYLLKDTPRGQLAEAVRAAARGETVLPPPVARRLMTQVRGPGERLTRRETEVLALVAKGLSNPAIGAEPHIGEATVKTHLLNVFTKLGVDDRTRAVTVAYERGLLPPPGR